MLIHNQRIRVANSENIGNLFVKYSENRSKTQRKISKQLKIKKWPCNFGSDFGGAWNFFMHITNCNQARASVRQNMD